MTDPASPRSSIRPLLVVMIASGGPFLFGIDLAVRGYLFASQPADLRQEVAAIATRLAWFVIPGPVLGGIAGFLLYPRIYAHQAARSSTPGGPQNADLTALMITASMPQFPALLGDLCLMLGADMTPVACSTAVSVLGVLLIAFLARPPASPGTPAGQG